MNEDKKYSLFPELCIALAAFLSFVNPSLSNSSVCNDKENTYKLTKIHKSPKKSISLCPSSQNWAKLDEAWQNELILQTRICPKKTLRNFREKVCNKCPKRL